jgi:protease IV
LIPDAVSDILVRSIGWIRLRLDPPYGYVCGRIRSTLTSKGVFLIMMIRSFAFSLGVVAGLAGFASAAEETPAPVPIVLDITLKGGLTEEPAPVGMDGSSIRDNLKGVIERIGKAKADPNVKGLVVRIHGLSLGLAKGYELRQAIAKFRESGKKAYAFLESAENADYLVASAADEIVMPESGWLMIKGLAAEVTFYKGLFDKLGVKADWMQVGEFKSFGEPYTRTSMSPAFREEIGALLGDSYAMMAEAIARRQGIALADAKAIIDGGPYSPSAAKAVGLINKIGYADQIEVEVARSIGLGSIKLDTRYGKKVETIDLNGIAGLMKMVQMLSGEGPKKAETKASKIALIYASGSIMTGKSTSSLLGETTMGSETIVKYLRDAEKDKTVKAIVLRVDSPGGSALASDLIWREVVRIEKPIVASMSDVAASGGYYISMGTDKIFAEPGTLTGSIGVTGGKFVLSGLMEKLGVTTDTITVGKNGTLNSINQPFSETERAAMKRLMDDTYHQFVAKAAQGRKMTFEQLNKLAGGRVYTGRQAQKLGLVDEIGTLEDALASAKQLAGIPEEETPELLVLPKAQGFLEALVGPLEDRDVFAPAIRVTLPLPEVTRPILTRLEQFARIYRKEPVAVMLPFAIDIH